MCGLGRLGYNRHHIDIPCRVIQSKVCHVTGAILGLGPTNIQY